MKCPKCKKENFDIINTRKGINNSIRRRRVCKNCNERFTTYEKILNKNKIMNEREIIKRIKELRE